MGMGEPLKTCNVPEISSNYARLLFFTLSC